jgi:hypothetical protein
MPNPLGLLQKTNLNLFTPPSICYFWLGQKLQSAEKSVRFEVFTAVTMKNGVFWDVTPCGSCKN